MRLKSLFNMRSGQGTIATVFLFAVVILLIIFVALLTSEAGVFDQEVDVQINNRIDEVRGEAIVSSILNDYLWRAEDIDKGKYNNKMAKDVTSYYFSTSGDTVYIGEEGINKSEVGDDLEAYFDHILNEHLVQSTDRHAYWFRIEHGDEQINVTNGQFSEDPSQWTRSNFAIGLKNGEQADASLVFEETEPNVPDIEGVP